MYYNIKGCDYSPEIRGVTGVKVIVETPEGKKEKILMQLATANRTNGEATQQAIENCLRLWEENKIEYLRTWGFPEDSKTDVVILTVAKDK